MGFPLFGLLVSSCGSFLQLRSPFFCLLIAPVMLQALNKAASSGKQENANAMLCVDCHSLCSGG